MGAHAIGNDKQMAFLPKAVSVFGCHNNMRILVVGSAHTHVGAFRKM
jgi:hypothetical protein